MSASLENVPRGGSDVAEVASLEQIVREWEGLDSAHQEAAVLATEHPIMIDGFTTSMFSGKNIATLADQLGSNKPAPERTHG